ncbi:MAG TPA: DUF5916 domain-containing protein [Pyrinomonadaceae bacterium]|nr:DUF5916 domain-containing protein [Pyrinomonadaceae bacterium]
MKKLTLVSLLLLACACAPAYGQQPALAKASPPASPAPSTTPTPAASPAPSTADSVAVADVPSTDKLADKPAGAEAKPAGAATAAKAGAVALPAEKAAPVRIPKFDKAPVIDGKLDDEIWKSAAVLKDFYQTNPGDNIAPTAPTEVFIGYDARNLYVAFKAYDDPSKVRATVARRDNVFGEDNVRLYLDTYNDQRKAYVLGFNPFGVQQDGIHTEGQGVDFSVDIVMESKGQMTPDGYVVEVAIPFKSLRYTAGKDKFWGLHVWRNIDRNSDEMDSWMPISRDKSGFLSQAGKITGLEGLATERTLELIPSLTVSQTTKRFRTLSPWFVRANPGLHDPGRMVNKPVELDPGLSVKLGITPTVTLDAAFNPDFAQVEADALVNTANQRFPIFFEEKRPFFLEGIDVFRTQIAAVHTRTIVDPDAAVKLTGKQGRTTFGLLLASDNAPGNFTEEERHAKREELDFLRRPQEGTETDSQYAARLANARSVEGRFNQFLDKNAYVGILRLKRDIGKESTVGLLATTYNFIERHNHVGGFDARFRLNPQTVFSVQALGTHSRGFFYSPVEDKSIYRTGNGFVYAYSFERSGRNLYFSASGVGRTRDYRAELGFTRRVNTNNQSSYVRYGSTPNPKARLISWSLSNYADMTFDWQGRSQGFGDEAQFQMSFPRSTFISVGYFGNYVRLFEEEFGRVRRPAQFDAEGNVVAPARSGAFFGHSERSTVGKNVFAYGGSTLNKQLSFFYFFGYRVGEFDYDFGAGRRFPRVSPAALADPRAPLDPGAGNLLYTNGNFTYKPTNALNITGSFSKNRLVRQDTGRVAFDSNIFSTRVTHQFTRFMFLRGRLDYDTLGSRVRGQLLLGYTPSPGTGFYAGYNDDLNRNGFNPFTGQLEPGFRRNGRTFFVKMSYLFRKSFERGGE